MEPSLPADPATRTRGIVDLALTASCLPLVLLAAPVTVYFPNAEHFAGPPGQVLRPFLVAVAAAVAAMALVLALVPRRIYDVLRVLLPAVALAALLQTHVLVGQHGVLTGQTLDLRAGTREWLQALPTLLLPLLALLYRGPLQRHATFLSAVAVAWSAVGLVVDVSRSERSVPGDAARWTRLVQASSRFNIFHFMADSFQADAFARLLEDRPGLARELPGFTFFADQAGYSNWTILSFPVMWSGRRYFAEPFDKGAYLPRLQELLASGYVPALEARGYRVNLLPPSRALCLEGADCFTIFDEIQASARQSVPTVRWLGIPIRASEDSVFLADLALFRLLPPPFKEWAYQGGRWRLTPAWRQRVGPTSATVDLLVVERQLPISIRVARRYIDDLHVGTDEPAYHFVHLFPPHRPFILDEQCGARTMSTDERRAQWNDKDPEKYRRQAACAWSVIEQWLAKIRALGLYDSSAIVIESDTGLGIVPTPPAGPDGFDTLVGFTRDELMAYANPLLLVKPPRATGPFRTSLAPTDHASSAATVRAWAGLEPAGDERRGVFELAEDELRPRPFVVSGDIFKGGGVGDFHSFEIRGPVRSPTSWVDLGTFAGFGERIAPPSPRR